MWLRVTRQPRSPHLGPFGCDGEESKSLQGGRVGKEELSLLLVDDRRHLWPFTEKTALQPRPHSGPAPPSGPASLISWRDLVLI